MWGKCGSMFEPCPSALRSELRALAEILRHMAGNLVIHVDNKEVVDGVQEGKLWCCPATREGADIWKEVRGVFQGVPNVQVVKAKAHLQFSHVLEDRSECAHWCGNAVVGGQRQRATWLPAWYRWLVRFAAS